MSIKRVTPRELPGLLSEGYRYVDVRSVPEYTAGHPAGALNIPLVHKGPMGPQPNPVFLTVFANVFPEKDAKVVVGCASGGRSYRAAQLLAAQGYTDVIDLAGGLEGERDPSGRVVKGYRAEGLPVETMTPGGSWEELSKIK